MLYGLAANLIACGAFGPADRHPVQFSEAPSPHGQNRFANWPFSPRQIETELLSALTTRQFKPLVTKATAAGTSGANKVTVFFRRVGQNVTFKWKPAPSGDLDGFNNSPRRELAAYQIQRLFLEPEDYVVPTSFILCAPRDEYVKHYGPTPASVPAADCVLGNASIWLLDVTIPEVLYEKARFMEEPHYAYFLSNLNLLTYLIAHRDARKGNFMISQNDKRPQVFSIDNGESFGSFPYNFFVANWDVIRVPALRKDSVDRLRKLRRGDLDFLGIVAQLEKDENGILQPVPAGDNLEPARGVRIQEGTVQFGLTTSEIDGVWKRIQDLIAEVEAGKLPVF
jgi:hypothetical protein